MTQSGFSGRFGYTGQAWLPEIGLSYRPGVSTLRFANEGRDRVAEMEGGIALTCCSVFGPGGDQPLVGYFGGAVG